MEKISCIRVFADATQINNCRNKVEENQTAFTALSQVLELAGNEVRLKILYLLDQEKELCPCDISDILQMTVPAISQHLRKLKDGNIIQSKKIGQTIFYSLKKEHVEILTPLFRFINTKSEKEKV